MKKKRSQSIRLSENNGFTLIELMIVLAIMSILLAIAVISYMDTRDTTNDMAAQNDARNIITAVHDNFFSKDDVNYWHDWDDGSQIGATRQTDGGNRTPVYHLSPGVKANVVGFSSPNELGTITFYSYHVSGTNVSPHPLFPSIRKRIFSVSIEEETGDVSTSFTN